MIMSFVSCIQVAITVTTLSLHSRLKINFMLLSCGAVGGYKDTLYLNMYSILSVRHCPSLQSGEVICTSINGQLLMAK